MYKYPHLRASSSALTVGLVLPVGSRRQVKTTLLPPFPPIPSESDTIQANNSDGLTV